MFVRNLCLGVKCELEVFVEENGFIRKLKFWMNCFFVGRDKEMELLFGDFVLTWLKFLSLGSAFAMKLIVGLKISLYGLSLNCK